MQITEWARPGLRGRERERNKGRSAILIAISVIVLASNTGPVSAAAPGSTPKSYYLALGDSVTFGYQASKIVPGFTADDFDTGYVDVFASELPPSSRRSRSSTTGVPANRRRRSSAAAARLP